ncbi:hypothetical protein LV75_005521 [Actinokineospora diospyrosa]|uniref:Uncharacterized protein n=1 Tax=Actinokineospora diospyrosa TaxID=103728 RepID=A0ABT1IK27_9PSEU|nr:hypothetical protein [Actinokineospora diospyrosa]
MPPQPNPLNTRTQRCQRSPLDTLTRRCQPAPARSAPTHKPSTWTLGLSGANWPSVRSAPTHSANHWTVGPCGANPLPVRSAQSTVPARGHSDPAVPTGLPSGPPQPTCPAHGHSDLAVSAQPVLGCPASPAPGQSDSLVPSARWGGPVLCGGTAPVAFPRGRACFWAPALRFCVGCRRGPAQNRSTASSFYALSRIGRRGRRQATRRPIPVAEVAARQRGRPRNRTPQGLARAAGHAPPHPRPRSGQAPHYP